MNWGKVNVLNQLNFELNNGEKLTVGPWFWEINNIKNISRINLPTKGELRIFGEKQTYLRLDQNNPPDVRLVSEPSIVRIFNY